MKNLVSKRTHRLRIGILVAVIGVFSLCLLYACAPNTASEEPADTASSGDTGEAVAISWTTETECGTCHLNEHESMENSASDSFLHANMSCVECHDDTDGLTKVHDGVTTADRVPMRLKRTGVDENLCISCHPQDEAFLAQTASTPLVDGRGTEVNPHELPQVASHEEITCSDCHKMHGDAADRADRAQKLCQSCHHSGVFECYTCHEQK